MRYVDDIIEAVNKHPYMSPVEKAVLRTRISPRPSSDELNKAKISLEGNGGAASWDTRVTVPRA